MKISITVAGNMTLKTDSSSGQEPMQLRTTNIEKLSKETFDVLIVGGGINGAVSAASLSNKGVKTALIDQGDFAGMTSQESSNLAWGGIKYMENMEFMLVRKLCKSRNHLIRHYPSTVREIRFFTTIAKGFRFPPVFIWMGTWLYWLIGSCFTKTPRYLTKARIQAEEPIIKTESAQGGFEYSDAYLHDNDARFVFGFIRSALTAGCIAANYIELVDSKRDQDGIWVSDVKNVISGETFTVRSKVLINSTGPLVDKLNTNLSQKTEHRILLSKGIHLLVEKVTPSKRVLAFFASDGRLFFVIPMGVRTCIGTTDTPVDSPTKKVTQEDREFVLNNINALLKLDKPLELSDIIAERCGVRPLVVSGESSGESDWMQLSRKHAVEVSDKDRYLTIFGGKLTDCLNVGDEVCEIIREMGIDMPYPDYKWYGEPDAQTRDRFMHQAELIGLDTLRAKESSERLSTRLWRRYGAAAFRLLEMIQADPDQAEVLIKGTEYLRCELREAARREMITKLSDFLRRRSKIALIEHRETIRSSAGLLEACQILFGDEANEKLEEYFIETDPQNIS
ncbi:MAG: glycerol-3-phosphate dehydrogenase [Desulforhopalus sp.]